MIRGGWVADCSQGYTVREIGSAVEMKLPVSAIVFVVGPDDAFVCLHSNQLQQIVVAAHF